MEYKIEQSATELVVKASGRLTYHDHDVIHRLILLLQTTHTGKQVIDLEALEFIDSAGLGMLLILHDDAKTRQVGFVLRKPRGEVQRVLKVARMIQIMQIEES